MKQRNATVDFLKFVFAIIIVIFHGKNIALGNEVPVFIGGSIGVDFFFIVSGYYMAYSALKKPYSVESLGIDTLDFMKHKISGLLPNFYVAWIIGFIVSHIFDNQSLIAVIKDGISAFWELIFVTESGLMGFRANAVTWYISAMLLAMLILYPLLRKYKDTYFYVLCPIIVIFLLGITYQEFANLRKPHAWIDGFIYKSLIRATMEIALGTIIYKLSKYISKIEFTILSRVLFFIIEVLAIGGVIIYSFDHEGSKIDWYLVAALAIGVMISASSVSLSANIFRGRIFVWMGEFSFSLFLGHGYWSHALAKMEFMRALPYMQRMTVYIIIAFVTGLCIMYVSKLIKYLWSRNTTSFSKAFIKCES